MSRTFALSFAATVGVIVPAAWNHLDATIDKDGKHVRPLRQELEVDGARVTIDVDHNLIHSGDRVTAKLRAFSPTPKRVAVDLTVLRTNDEFGSRVAEPPKAIDKEHFTLEAAPDGGKVVDTQLTMTATTGNGGKLNWFRIIVTPRGEKVDTFGNASGDSVAAVGVLGWTDNDFKLAITHKGKLVAGTPFEVAVRITNTSDHVMKHVPFVQLGTQVGLSGLEDGDVTIEDADDHAEHASRLKPGASVVQKFTVTPKQDDLKSVTFIASAYVWGNDGPAPITSGAVEARTFKVKPVNPAVAVR
jgi:hypothetical protein